MSFSHISRGTGCRSSASGWPVSRSSRSTWASRRTIGSRVLTESSRVCARGSPPCTHSSRISTSCCVCCAARGSTSASSAASASCRGASRNRGRRALQVADDAVRLPPGQMAKRNGVRVYYQESGTRLLDCEMVVTNGVRQGDPHVASTLQCGGGRGHPCS